MVKIYVLDDENRESERVRSLLADRVSEIFARKASYPNEKAYNRALDKAFGAPSGTSSSSSSDSSSSETTLSDDLVSPLSGSTFVRRPDFSAFGRAQLSIMGSEYVTLNTSLCLDAEELERWRSQFTLSSDGNEGRLTLEPCVEGENVCMTSPSDGRPAHTYLYQTLVDGIHVRLPFSPFECGVLNLINVAPTQLHPNGWGFMRAFAVVCEALGITPTVGLFFSFYQVKGCSTGNWVYISAQKGKGFLVGYRNSYKLWKNKFFRVRPSSQFPHLFEDELGAPLFPHFWTDEPRSVSGFDYEMLSEEEKEGLACLQGFVPIHCRDILRSESSPQKLLDLLSECAPYLFVFFLC